ncbi:MAG TPA: hypothetical protein VNE61_15665 [Ktedonobacteraceae bacterium]|nr:hypothetical protein [Ktedonobacteraceae bacterium]
MITGYRVVPGSALMYNLTVAYDHTFVVGSGEWVVHNDCGIASSGGLGDRNDAGTPSGFADDAKLTDHFNRHGSDFGATSKEIYQQQANDFLSGVPDDSAVQLTRTNGDVVRWDPSTGEFGVVSSTGGVRTYYSIGGRADPAAYFLRQYW